METESNAEPTAVGKSELERYAEAMQIDVATSINDVGEVHITADEEVVAWIDDVEDQTGVEIAVLEDGRIYTATPSSPFVWQACRLVERCLNVPAQVLPATPLVVHTLRNPQQLENLTSAQVDATTSGNATEAQRLVANIVEQAVLVNATDIHLESRDTIARARYRVSGILRDLAEMSREDAVMLAHYLFSSARRGARQWIQVESQNAAVDVVISRGRVVPLRISTIPEIRGFDIILRVLRHNQRVVTLENAGYTDLHIDLINEAFNRPYGVVALSGPTGSGKSTTLLAALERLPANLKIVSLEAPVERAVRNCSHVTASDEKQLAEMLPDVNRWDNDVTVLGELRDSGTAKALVDFVTSGKLVVTTVHASNCLAVPRRMAELGIQWSILCDPEFLVALINQRLMPALCTNCSIPLSENMDLVPRYRWDDFEELFSDTMDTIRLSGPGCSQCVGGASGRTLVAEVILVDDLDRDDMRDQNILGWRRNLSSRGWMPIVDHALAKIRSSDLDPLVAERMAGQLSGGRGGRIEINYRSRIESLVRTQQQQQQ